MEYDQPSFYLANFPSTPTVPVSVKGHGNMSNSMKISVASSAQVEVS